MRYKVKFGICVVVGLFGVQLVVMRASINQIMLGFLLVALALGFGYYYLALVRKPKNPMEDEIKTLLEKDQNKEKQIH